jgi:hypothetical protein
MDIETGDTGLHGSAFLACWNPDVRETARYTSTPLSIFQHDDQLTIEWNEFAYAVSEDGKVYTAEMSDSVYCIRGFMPLGECFIEIGEDWISQRRTDRELAAELHLLEAREIKGQPGLYRNAVAGLFVDGTGRIWVRQGSDLHPCFRVYSPTGDELFTAECPALPDTCFDLKFAWAEDRLIAWNTDPVDYPKVIILEVSP